MNSFVFSTELIIEMPQEEVFSFFSNAYNLTEISPPWLNFQVLNPPPIIMGVGTRIDYQLKLHGIPMRVQCEITSWHPPYAFVDEQRKGPYRGWVHTHTFVETEIGTIIGDEVEYAVPGGDLVNRLFIRPDIEKIFEYRTQKLQELLNPKEKRHGFKSCL